MHKYLDWKDVNNHEQFVPYQSFWIHRTNSTTAVTDNTYKNKVLTGRQEIYVNSYLTDNTADKKSNYVEKLEIKLTILLDVNKTLDRPKILLENDIDIG